MLYKYGDHVAYKVIGFMFTVQVPDACSRIPKYGHPTDGTGGVVIVKGLSHDVLIRKTNLKQTNKILNSKGDREHPLISTLRFVFTTTRRFALMSSTIYPRFMTTASAEQSVVLVGVYLENGRK